MHVKINCTQLAWHRHPLPSFVIAIVKSHRRVDPFYPPLCSSEASCEATFSSIDCLLWTVLFLWTAHSTIQDLPKDAISSLCFIPNTPSSREGVEAVIVLDHRMSSSWREKISSLSRLLGTLKAYQWVKLNTCFAKVAHIKPQQDCPLLNLLLISPELA